MNTLEAPLSGNTKQKPKVPFHGFITHNKPIDAIQSTTTSKNVQKPKVSFLEFSTANRQISDTQCTTTAENISCQLRPKQNSTSSPLAYAKELNTTPTPTTGLSSVVTQTLPTGTNKILSVVQRVVCKHCNKEYSHKSSLL